MKEGEVEKALGFGRNRGEEGRDWGMGGGYLRKSRRGQERLWRLR